MAKYIAVFNDTIDGIKINGFLVMTENDVETYERLAESITWSFSYKFDDIELEYSNGEDLLSMIEFKEITFDESKMLKRLFNNHFGFFITESFLEQVIGDEDENYEDGEDDEYNDEDYYDDSRYDNYDYDDDDDEFEH